MATASNPQSSRAHTAPTVQKITSNGSDKQKKIPLRTADPGSLRGLSKLRSFPPPPPHPPTKIQKYWQAKKYMVPPPLKKKSVNTKMVCAAAAAACTHRKNYIYSDKKYIKICRSLQLSSETKTRAKQFFSLHNYPADVPAVTKPK